MRKVRIILHCLKEPRFIGFLRIVRRAENKEFVSQVLIGKCHLILVLTLCDQRFFIKAESIFLLIHD